MTAACIAHDLSTASLTPFDSGGFQVRAACAADGTVWFVAADIAAALGHLDLARMCAPCKDHQQYGLPLEHGGSLLLLSESGVGKVLIRSAKPTAELLHEWLLEEVLPGLRHGNPSSTLKATRSSGPRYKHSATRAWLRTRLAEQQLSVGQFATACKRSSRTVSRWLNGQTYPCLEDQITIAEVLSMGTHEVFERFAIEARI